MEITGPNPTLTESETWGEAQHPAFQQASQVMSQVFQRDCNTPITGEGELGVLNAIDAQISIPEINRWGLEIRLS